MGLPAHLCGRGGPPAGLPCGSHIPTYSSSGVRSLRDLDHHVTACSEGARACWGGGGVLGLLSVRSHFCWGEGVGAAKGLLPCFLVAKGNQPTACSLAVWRLKFGPAKQNIVPPPLPLIRDGAVLHTAPALGARQGVHHTHGQPICRVVKKPSCAPQAAFGVKIRLEINSNQIKTLQVLGRGYPGASEARGSLAPGVGRKGGLLASSAEHRRLARGRAGGCASHARQTHPSHANMACGRIILHRAATLGCTGGHKGSDGVPQCSSWPARQQRVIHRACACTRRRMTKQMALMVPLPWPGGRGGGAAPLH